MMQSFHQSAETLEILFNKKKYDTLPDKLKNIIVNAVEAASADMWWKSVDRYSQDYIEIQAKDKVRVYKTPNGVLQAQLKVWDDTIAKKGRREPVVQEGSRFAARVRRTRHQVAERPAGRLQDRGCPLLQRSEERLVRGIQREAPRSRGVFFGVPERRHPE